MVNNTSAGKLESRQRILDAARSEFSEKGFDGARVDDIARRAEVNKALIYYYFKSKDELLQELLRQFLGERRSIRDSTVDHDSTSRDYPDRSAEFDVQFLFERRDILRIALMEDLKASKDGIPSGGTVLKHWLEALDESKAAYAERGYRFRHTPRVIAAMYFYHLMPSLAFVTLGETLAKAVGIDHAALREEFLKLVHETMGTHFRTVFEASVDDAAPEVTLPVRTREPAAVVAPPQQHLDASATERQKLVAKHMPLGRLVEFPLKEKARLAVIEHISRLFEPGTVYTERQVDAILKGVADDHTKVRRYLVDYRFLDRTPDGGKYWTWEGGKP
jgi:AcrR family transcriptional regulator